MPKGRIISNNRIPLFTNRILVLRGMKVRNQITSKFTVIG
jgi:hypothetical protein